TIREGKMPPESAGEKTTPFIPYTKNNPELIEQTVRRDGARFVLQVPLDKTVEGYKIERLQRGFIPDPSVGGARIVYEPEPFPDGSAEVVGSRTVVRKGKEFNEVVVDLSGLSPGTNIYWQIIPVGKDGRRGDALAFHFRTLPPWRFPWTSAAFAACSATLIVVLYLRWRSRRPSH
ncbi:MAG: hypothetical protein ACO3YO_07150, partial [Chthoniobacterales bacterium]